MTLGEYMDRMIFSQGSTRIELHPVTTHLFLLNIQYTLILEALGHFVLCSALESGVGGRVVRPIDNH